jgi:defect-in-organelle-trafficking protein DotC
MMRAFMGCILLLLAGCSSQKVIINGANRDQILAMSSDVVLYPYELTAARFELVRDSALTYAAQCGLRYYYNIINQQLLAKSAVLDRVFNFQPLMLDHDLLPPVVVQTDRTVEQISPSHVVLADRTFKILKPGTFITTPLTWKDYLIEELMEPTLPEKGFLPGDNTEKEVWIKYVQQGWEAGKEQAFQMFKNNLSQLYQDYSGMIAFHRLFQQGLMTAPIINEIESGITMSRDAMNINQRILAIAQQGFLEGDYNRWHSYIFFTE